MKTILGIDPGSQVTGYGILEISKDQIKPIGFGVIALPKGQPFAQRLGNLSKKLLDLYALWKPQHVVVEKVFLGKNADSAFKLGHARGVAVALAAASGAEIFEYATRSVKQGITGQGGAPKEQVQLALTRILGLKQEMPMDASDALAMAYYHVLMLETERRLNRLKEL